MVRPNLWSCGAHVDDQAASQCSKIVSLEAIVGHNWRRANGEGNVGSKVLHDLQKGDINGQHMFQYQRSGFNPRYHTKFVTTSHGVSKARKDLKSIGGIDPLTVMAKWLLGCHFCYDAGCFGHHLFWRQF